MHYLPTRIIYGEGAVRRGYAYIDALGGKALLVTGKASAVRSGALDDVLAVLNGLKKQYAIFAEVDENPVLETVVKGAEVFAEHQCDFLVGIGGGSPIDTAKAISLTAANHLPKSDIYNTTLFKRNFPLVAVPTTSGTGTEATQYAVLTDTGSARKAGFGHDLAFPALALVDPKYTLSLPASVTLNTGIDALSHLLEGLYSNKRTPLIYPLIYEGVKLILHHLKPVLDNLADLGGREALMRASLYGGITIAHTSTTFQHSVGYPLTTVFGVPHGLSNGIVMKQVMDLYYPAVKTDLDNLFDYLRLDRHHFYDWLDNLNMKVEMNMTDQFVAAKIPEVLASRNMANNPVPVSSEDVARIYGNLMP